MKYIFKKINSSIKNSIMLGISPQKLALSFSAGIFIAFSPLIGFHWLLVLGCSFLLGLDLAVVFAASLINNPFTAIPCYTSGYAIGYLLFHKILNLNTHWIFSLDKIFGNHKICLLSFFVGGHLLGLIIACMSYPVILLFSKKLLKKRITTRS